MLKADLDIITSPQGERMRQMVTEGFYDRSRIGLALFNAIGLEYDEMATWLETLSAQAFLQTCDAWSIAIWEAAYGFQPDNTLSLEERRQRLLAKRLQQPPINPARIEAVLAALTGCPVHVTENIAAYTFKVEVDETDTTIYDYQAALDTLRRIKPSHLSFKYESLVTAEYTETDYSAGALAEFLQEYFMEEDDTVLITNVWDYDAGVTSELTRETFSS